MLNLDLQDPDQVVAVFREGAEANRTARCRRGSTDVIEAPGVMIATGDIHDNPLNFARLVSMANLDETSAEPRAHVVLHEVIHSDRLLNGMDFSYRALARVAAIKSRHPELVHNVLANHELSQIVGAGIVKDGVRVVDAFNDGLAYAFGDRTHDVAEAIDAYVRSLPLALRCVNPGGGGDTLCAHSIPSPAVMSRFDPAILERDLSPDDYEPRRGSAHLMVWGRGYDAELIEDLVERWGVRLFILGHEHAPNGVMMVPPCAIVLNSDHEHAACLPFDLAHPPEAAAALELVKPLSDLG